MKNLLLIISLGLLVGFSSYAQDKKVKFSNITEATFGFQVGKKTQVTSVEGGEDNRMQVAGYKFPAPRVSSSFGALFGDIFFLGPGVAYTFQPADNNGTVLDPNANQHKLSLFGHARIHFAKGRFRPYTELKGGYTHIFTEDVSTIYDKEVYTWDGAFVEPAIGFGFKLGGHAQLNVSLGYQFLNVWNRSDGFTSTSAFEPELRDAYHRLLLSFGFSFY